MPALEGLNKKYTAKKVAVIGLLLDPHREKWALQAVKDTTFPHLKDDGRFADHVFGVPQTLIVDKNGQILDIVVGMRSLQEFSALADKYL
ncbi:AhpC/TSA family protein [Desulforamulus aeronauticus DSM 10349]|uniref:AhpC/TSA family protein n=2 Tax=Desulforamulus aeronauticus TaxID=53343 RepID=A0A1M6VV37_9FIRM|nr:AhpC/TSA family protein [Desulforamulus aeronauticus DSM 10349]